MMKKGNDLRKPLKELHANTKVSQREIYSILGNPKAKYISKLNRRRRIREITRRKTVTFGDDAQVCINKNQYSSSYPIAAIPAASVYESFVQEDFDELNLDETFSSIESVDLMKAEIKESSSVSSNRESIASMKSFTNKQNYTTKDQICIFLRDKKIKLWHRKLRTSPPKVLKTIKMKSKRRKIEAKRQCLLCRVKSTSG